MIDSPLSAVRRVRAAVMRSLRDQKRFMRGAFSLILAMQHGKPHPRRSHALPGTTGERLKGHRPTPGVLQREEFKVSQLSQSIETVEPFPI